MLVALAVLAGCDVGGSLLPDDPGPAIVASMPADGDVGVRRAIDFRVYFDRPLLPATVNRANVRIESGSISELLSVRFDPIDDSIAIAAYGTRPLDADVAYRLVIELVRDHEGRAVSPAHTIRFETGSEVGELPAPREVTFAEVAPIFTARCATAGCHAPPAPALGLDLSSVEAIERTAIGATSRELPSGTTGTEGGRGAVAFAAMPIVDRLGGAGHPETSYLLYKILGTDGIFGERMPAPGGPGPLLDDAETRLVADWILSGAPTR